MNKTLIGLAAVCSAYAAYLLIKPDAVINGWKIWLKTDVLDIKLEDSEGRMFRIGNRKQFNRMLATLRFQPGNVAAVPPAVATYLKRHHEWLR